jgi:hypothetical protein
MILVDSLTQVHELELDASRPSLFAMRLLSWSFPEKCGNHSSFVIVGCFQDARALQSFSIEFLCLWTVFVTKYKLILHQDPCLILSGNVYVISLSHTIDEIVPTCLQDIFNCVSNKCSVRRLQLPKKKTAKCSIAATISVRQNNCHWGMRSQHSFSVDLKFTTNATIHFWTVQIQT